MNSGSLRRISIVTVMAWIAALMGPIVLPHAQPFDLACSDEAWTGPRTTAQFESALPATGDDDHCVVCHLQRAAREAVSEPSRSLPAPDPGRARMVARARTPAVAPADRTSARAPPATFL
jgi:hypothetical protein